MAHFTQNGIIDMLRNNPFKLDTISKNIFLALKRSQNMQVNQVKTQYNKSHELSKFMNKYNISKSKKIFYIFFLITQ